MESQVLATRGERKGILGRIYVYANGDEHYGLHIEHYYGLVTDIMLIAYECNGKMRSFELRRGRGNLSRKKMERENMVDSMVRGRTLTGTLKEIFQYEPYMLGIRAEKAEPRTIKYG